MMRSRSRMLIAVLFGALAGCATPGPYYAQPCPAPNVGGAIVGGLAGGLIGSAIGGGAGRDLAIAAGAGTGAVIGSHAPC